MADIKTTEEIGLELQKRARVNEKYLTDNEKLVISVPVEDVNFKSAIKRLTLEECDHLLQIVTDNTTLREIGKRRVALEGEDIPDTEKFAQRTIVEPESWDNEGFRERMASILASAIYEDFSIEDIIVPHDKPGKFQYRRFRENDTLYDSILKNGVLEEITLQKKDGQYFIIDGNSRLSEWLRAREQDSSLPKPVFRILVDIPDAYAAQLAVELNRFGQNLDGEDLQALVIRLVEEAGIKQVDIAGQLNISKGYVSDIVSAFQKVPPEARAMIEDRRWTVKHGRFLAKLSEYPKEQEQAMKLAIKNGWTTDDLEQRVKKALLQIQFEKDASTVIDDVVGDITQPGQQIKEVTDKQLERIHSDLEKKFTSYSSRSYGGKRVLKDGIIEAPANISTTKKVLKKAGYVIVPSPVRTKTSVEGEPEVVIPSMPSEDILMEGSKEKYTCQFCDGPTHPVVVEELGFETADKYLGPPTYSHGNNHLRCDLEQNLVNLMDELAELQESITECEKQLKNEPLSKLMQKKGLTLEEVNNKAHAIYKDELESRKQKWREENLPDPKTTSKKGTKTGEVVLNAKTVIEDHDVSADLELLQMVRDLQPNLVDECFFDAYEMYLHKNQGFESQAKVKKTLQSSMGVVSRAFLKISDAIEEQRE